MQVKIKPEQLQSVIQQMLHEIPQKCDNAIDRAIDKVSKDAVKELKASSPVKDGGANSGRYAKGWAVKKVKGSAVIYNKTDPGLTHLLENGHDVISHGKKVGHYSGEKHIKPVEEKVIEDMTEEVEKELKNL